MTTPTGWSLHHHLVRRFVSVAPALAERVNALAAAEGISVAQWLSRAVLESATLHSGARKRGSRSDLAADLAAEQRDPPKTQGGR